VLPPDVPFTCSFQVYAKGQHNQFGVIVERRWPSPILACFIAMDVSDVFAP
jgi:hypothetical protein